MNPKKIFYITIEDILEGIDAISLVREPAVEKDFLKFSKEEVKFHQDEEKRIITGVVALADTPIYRYDERFGEYWVVFKKEMILEMVQKFFKEDKYKSVNLEHDNNKFVNDIFVFESIIVDKERGIVPKEFEDVPDGSWILSYKVDNEELWNKIKEDKDFKGFSLQGLFSFQPSSFSKMEEYLKKLTK